MDSYNNMPRQVERSTATTNFKIWLDNLDAETAAEFFVLAKSNSWDCVVCPAWEAGYCKIPLCKNPFKVIFQIDCEKFFLEWANTPVQPKKRKRGK